MPKAWAISAGGADLLDKAEIKGERMLSLH